MRRACTRAAIHLAILLWPASGALALNPGLDVSQYSHTAWKVRDGFSSATIKCIAQTPDGYLWLGTESGLLRFDGVRAVRWQPPPDQSLPSDDIWSLLASRDGALWVGTAKGLVRWKNGQLARYPDVNDRIVVRLLQDRKETVWISAIGVPAGRLCAIRGADVTCYGDDGGFGYGIWALREDGRGNLWLGVNNGVWRW